MKNSISILVFLFAALFAVGQSPQGINYQAVAFTNSGPLSNRAISLRLSVLDSASSGTAVYVETQATTTDTTGLFSVVVGGGTAVTGTFAGINWGHNNKWLKVEIDTAGGTNYVLMGISQFMSVPYALYAGSVRNDYSSVDYPDGLLKTAMVTLPAGQAYAVPAGKNLYIHTQDYIAVRGDTLRRADNGGQRRPVGLSPGDTVMPISFPITGILVDQRVNWITKDITTAYTVPVGYDLVILNCSVWNNSSSFLQSMTIDGIGGIDYLYFGINIINAGHTISNTSPPGTGHMFINGYLRPQ